MGADVVVAKLCGGNEVQEAGYFFFPVLAMPVPVGGFQVLSTRRLTQWCPWWARRRSKLGLAGQLSVPWRGGALSGAVPA